MNEEKIAEILEETAEKIAPAARFTTELERQLKDAHKPKERFAMFKNKNLVSTLGLIGAIAILLLALNWAFRSLAPKTIPGAGKTPVPTRPQESLPTPLPATPNAESYDFRGTKLYLAQPLPESPANANVYLLNKDQPATLDEARALAQRFGIQSDAYTASGQIPNTTDYVFTDGKQMLSVHSNFYWHYTADIVKNYNNFNTSSNPNAEEIVSKFLKSHGFDFAYQLEGDGLRGGYDVRPISPDGRPMQYEYFGGPVMNVTLDENGQVLNVQASLMAYNQTPLGAFGIISAKEALQRVLDDNVQAGKIEGMSSASKPIQEWKRVYPINQTITIYGYRSLIPALDPNQSQFIQIDAYPIFGNIEGLVQLKGNGKQPDRPYIQAKGQFVVENGIEKFKVQSWQASGNVEYGYAGTLERENGQAYLTVEIEGGGASVGGRYMMPDVPDSIPMPFEHTFVVGTKIGNVIEWKLIDDRMAAGGGGGGGGGGLGFYQLNLSGTPVPFPTATPVPTLSSGGNYVVQAGDTINSIASANGTTADELMKANGLNDPTIFIGQTLYVPNPISNPNQPPVGKQYEGQRGILTVSIYNKPDGSQRSEYYLSINNLDGLYPYVILEGNGLDKLKAYHNRPVEIWGKVVRYDEQFAMPVVNVERFNIPFPDLQFQIIKGTQKSIVIEGKTAILFTANNGTSYIQMQNNGDIDINIPSYLGDEVIFEALIIPDETYGGYPTIRVYNSTPAISPKSGKPVELTITSDQPLVSNEPQIQNTAEPYTPPTLTIEKVELVYFVSNPLYQANDPSASRRSPYIQPAWHFSGHYSNGDACDILIQALKQEFLSPEIAPYIQGG